MLPDRTIVKPVADNVHQLHWLFNTASRAVGAVQPLTSPAQNHVVIRRHHKHFLVAGYKPYQALLHAGNECRQIYLAAYPQQRIWHLMFQVQVCLNICLILTFSQTSRSTWLLCTSVQQRRPQMSKLCSKIKLRQMLSQQVRSRAEVDGAHH